VVGWAGPLQTALALAYISAVKRRAALEIQLMRAIEIHQRRVEGIRCADCGKLFQPARRSDAIICSNACRQRLYRKRVADKGGEAK
jgi:uncharacterized OB-fold protein